MTINETDIASRLGEIKASLNYISDDIKILHSENKDRRNAIDGVANSLRDEISETFTSLDLEVKVIKQNFTQLSSEFSIAKWVIGVIVGALVLYFVGRILKVILPEIESQVIPQAVQKNR